MSPQAFTLQADDDWMKHPSLLALDDLAQEFTRAEADSDRERRLSDRSVKLMREAGLAKILQPARHGGSQADPRVFNEACRRLGAVAPCAGWVLGVVGVHHWNIALFADSVQQQVWGEDEEVWVSASYGPAGRATPVDGGFELTGRWGFSSGSDHCRWALVGGLSQEDGQIVYRHFLVERDIEYRVEDVWYASGLAGSGSNDLVVDHQFIPADRAMDTRELSTPRLPGLQVNTDPLYRIPWYTLFLNSIVTAMIGMSQTMVRDVCQIHGARVEADPAKMPAQATRVRLAEADAQADLAYLALQHNLTGAWEAIRSGRELTLAERMVAKRDHVTAVKLAVQAGNEAYAVGGPRAILTPDATSGTRLEKYWRDLNAGAHHAMNLPESSWGEYASWLIDGKPAGLH